LLYEGNLATQLRRTHRRGEPTGSRANHNAIACHVLHVSHNLGLPLDKDQRRVFQKLYQSLQEGGPRRSIYHAVIDRQAER
jgi:hypothetical protein